MIEENQLTQNPAQPEKPKKKRRFWWFFLGFWVLIFSFLFSLLFSPVQTFFAQIVAERLSEKWHASVSVEKLSLSLDGHLQLKGFLVKDQTPDTLIYAGNLKVRTLHLFNFLERPELSRCSISDGVIKVRELNAAGDHNFDFIVNQFESGAKSKSKSPAFVITKLNLTNVRLENHLFQGAESGPILSRKSVVINNFTGEVDNLRVEDQKILAELKSLSFHEKGGLTVKEMAVKVSLVNDTLKLSKLGLKTNFSNVSADAKFVFGEKGITYAGRLNDLNVDIRDIRYVTDEKVPFEQSLQARGFVKGNTNQVYLSRFRVSIDGEPTFQGTLGLSNLNDPKNIGFRLLDSKLFIDPALLAERFGQDSLANQLKPLGLVSFEGTLKGNPTHIEADGNLKSALGEVASEMVVDLGKVPSIKGNVTTTNLDLRPILPAGTEVQNITFSGNLDLTGNSAETLKGTANGYLSTATYNNETFRDIRLEGSFNAGNFTGLIASNDPQLKFKITGTTAFASKNPKHNFVAELDNLDLKKVGLSETPLVLSGKVKLEGNGTSIDDFKGKLEGERLMIVDNGKPYEFNHIALTSTQIDSIRTMNFESDWADVSASGQFTPTDVPNAFNNLLARYLPSYFTSKPNIPGIHITWDGKVKDTKRILDFAKIDELALKPITIHGYYRSEDYRLWAQVKTDSLVNGDFKFDFANVLISTDSEKMRVSVFSNEMQLNDSTLFSDLLVNTETFNDSIVFKSNLVRELGRNEGFLNGMLNLKNRANELYLDGSSMILNGNTWAISQDLPINFAGKSLVLNRLGLSFENQAIEVSGRLSTLPGDTVFFSAKEFNLNQLNSILRAYQTKLEGVTSIRMAASNLGKDPYFVADMTTTGLVVDTIKVGELFLKTDWKQLEKTLNVNANLLNNATNSRLDITGFVDLHDPKNEELDLTANMSRTDIHILDKVVGGDLRDIHGYATGFIKVYGTFEKPLLVGAVDVDSTSFIVDVLNTRYSTGKETVSLLFTDEFIDFNKARILDEDGGIAYLSGKMYHTYFRNTRFDLKLDVPETIRKNGNQLENRLMVYNQPNYRRGDMFYGVGYATGKGRIYGHISQINIECAVKSQKGTFFKIPLEETYYSGGADFLNFIKAGIDSSIQKRKVDLEGINLTIDLEATPDAEVFLIFDELAGDVIQGNGNGRLKFTYDKEGDFNMFGNYIINKGSYLFTWENVINKRFEIMPGGSLNWNGDPYHAQMDLQAVYKLNTTINNLVSQEYDLSRIQGSNVNKNIRYKVETVLKMTGDLMKPDIGFEIRIPALSPGDLAALKLRDVNNNQQELNNQVFGLLMLGQFINTNALSNTVTGGFNSVGEMVSSQLSNWLSKGGKNLNVNVNYWGQNTNIDPTSTRRQLQLFLNTTLMNGRVIVDGNLELGSDFLRTTAQTQAIGGTFSVEYLIDEEGKFRVKVFNKIEDNLLVASSTSNYRQGIGLTYTKEINDLSELYMIPVNYALEKWTLLKQKFGPAQSEPKPAATPPAAQPTMSTNTN